MWWADTMCFELDGLVPENHVPAHVSLQTSKMHHLTVDVPLDNACVLHIHRVRALIRVMA